MPHRIEDARIHLLGASVRLMLSHILSLSPRITTRPRRARYHESSIEAFLSRTQVEISGAPQHPHYSPSRSSETVSVAIDRGLYCIVKHVRTRDS